MAELVAGGFPGLECYLVVGWEVLHQQHVGAADGLGCLVEPFPDSRGVDPVGGAGGDELGLDRPQSLRQVSGDTRVGLGFVAEPLLDGVELLYERASVSCMSFSRRRRSGRALAGAATR